MPAHGHSEAEKSRAKDEHTMMRASFNYADRRVKGKRGRGKVAFLLTSKATRKPIRKGALRVAWKVWRRAAL